MPSHRTSIARELARTLLADIGDGGGSDAAALGARLAATLGALPPWARAIAEHFGSRSGWQRLDATALAERIAALDAFGDAFAEGRPPRVQRLILRPPAVQPRPFALEACTLPPLATSGDLAAWLGLSADALDWLAGAPQRYRDSAARPTAAAHYRCLLRAKASGGWRLVEAPKSTLKAVQRQLLHGLLDAVPVHEAAHGFVAGRSAVTHAAAHVAQPVVVRLDLVDFFPSIRAARVHALWRTLGMPEALARTLTTLCTARTPRAMIERMREGDRIDAAAARRYAAAHLPQGAPTSPALANLCAFRLDLRLDGLAFVFGARYTRYADDLVFSGPHELRTRLHWLRGWAAAIAEDEGFRLHPHKTRCMPQHRRQSVGGIVVNARPNAPRDEVDRLRALLHRCVHDGPRAHNRDARPDFGAHLLGRIAWVAQLNPRRGAKLRALYDRIRWPLVPELR